MATSAAEGELSAWVKQIRQNTGNASASTAQNSSDLEEEIRKSRLDRAKRRSRLSGEGLRGFPVTGLPTQNTGDGNGDSAETKKDDATSREDTLRRLMGQRSPPFTSPTSERPPSPTRNQSTSSSSNYQPQSTSTSSRGAALLSRYGGQAGPTGTANAPIGQNTSLASFMGGKASGPRLGKLSGDGRSAPPEAGLLDESRWETTGGRGNPLPGMTSGGAKPLASFLEARSVGNSSSGRVSPSKEEPVAIPRWGGGGATGTGTSTSTPQSRSTTTDYKVERKDRSESMGPPTTYTPSTASREPTSITSRPTYSPSSSYSTKEKELESPKVEKASFTTLYRSDSFGKNGNGSDSKKVETEDLKPIRSFVASPSPSATSFSKEKEQSASAYSSAYKTSILPTLSPQSNAHDFKSSDSYSQPSQNTTPTKSEPSPAFATSPSNSTDKLPTASLTRLSAQKMVGQRIREAQARAESGEVSGSNSSNSLSGSGSGSSPSKYGISPSSSNSNVGGGLRSPPGSAGGIRDRWPAGGMMTNNSTSQNSTSNNERKPWTPGRMGTALPGMTKPSTTSSETPYRSSTAPSDSRRDTTDEEEQRSRAPIRLPGLGGEKLPNAFRNQNSVESSFRDVSPTRNEGAVSSLNEEAPKAKALEHVVKSRARPPRRGGNVSSTSTPAPVVQSDDNSAINRASETQVRPPSPHKETHERAASPIKNYERAASPVKDYERPASPSRSFQRPASPIKEPSYERPSSPFKRPESPTKNPSYSYERPSSPFTGLERPSSPAREAERPASPMKPWERPRSSMKSPIKVGGEETPTRSLTNLEEHLNTLEGSGFRNQPSRRSTIVEDPVRSSSPKKGASTPTPTQTQMSSQSRFMDPKREIQLLVSSSENFQRVNVESLLNKASSNSEPNSSGPTKTIAIEILSILSSGSTTEIDYDESNIVYDNELLVIIHRFKEMNGLTSTKLYTREGKQFSKERKGGRKQKEEMKLKEIKDRYKVPIEEGDSIDLFKTLPDEVLIKRDGTRKTWDENNTFMMKVQGIPQGIYLDQCELKSESLNSNNCFVISLLGDLMIWFGNGSTKSEQQRILNLFKDKSSVSIYKEGKEDEFFWTFFSNQSYRKPLTQDSINFRSKLSQDQLVPNLYHLKSASEISIFKTSNPNQLFKNGIYLLVTPLEIFLLIGEDARSGRNLISMGLDLAQHVRDRNSSFIKNVQVLIFPTLLPTILTSIRGWEEDDLDHLQTSERSNRLLNVVGLEKARKELSRKSWSFEVLKDLDHLPVGVGRDMLQGLV